MIKTHFVFAVSFVAMMAVGSALANAPTGDESVGTAHTVYEDQNPTTGSGAIAGVTYVNKAVNKAGASAQAAEAHAAAAGASALDAASSAAAAAASAADANETLKSKADKSELENYVTTATFGAVSEAQTGLIADVQSLQTSVEDLEKNKQNASTIGTVNATNMGTDAATVVGAIKEVATEAATAQSTANTAKTNAATAQSTADSALSKANAAVVANNAIIAGTGTKITYDAKGLVTGSASLTASDIPTLSASKVTGLGTITAANMGTDATTVVGAIKEVATEAATAQSTADSALSKANAAVVANNAITAGTGTKITYDAKGLVTGSTSLTASDIPTLSASKVTGLGTITAANMGTDATTVVGAIKEVATEAATAQSTANTAKTNAATAQSTADSALSKANAAVVANNAITAGTGTKITYDAKGLVTGSASLAASDIPTLAIGKVSGLQSALDGKLSTTGTAAKATADADGNTITSTYATKAELNALSGTAGTLSTDVASLQTSVADLEANKQAKLTAGTNITISGSTISSKDTNTTYSAGTNISLSGTTFNVATGTPSTLGVVKVGQIPSGSETSTNYATIWVE